MHVLLFINLSRSNLSLVVRVAKELIYRQHGKESGNTTCRTFGSVQKCYFKTIHTECEHANFTLELYNLYENLDDCDFHQPDSPFSHCDLIYSQILKFFIFSKILIPISYCLSKLCI
jgi:hypothetical protein